MRGPLRINFLRALILVNLVALPVIFWVSRGHRLDFRGSQPQGDLPDYGRMPEFSLLEKSGRGVTAEEMRGTFWVANFIFTSCPNQCPLMTSKFSLLQKTLPKNVRLASFSVDPETDTPEKLRAYAVGYGVDENKWLFLTGENKQIRNILSALHLGNGEDPGMHSLRFVLLSPELRVLGYYNSEDGQALGQLNRDIQKWTHQA